MNKVVGEDFL